MMLLLSFLNVVVDVDRYLLSSISPDAAISDNGNVNDDDIGDIGIDGGGSGPSWIWLCASKGINPNATILLIAG